MRLEISQQEAQQIVAGLNSLVRQADDAVGAAAQVLPLRQKLEQAAAYEVKKSLDESQLPDVPHNEEGEE